MRRDRKRRLAGRLISILTLVIMICSAGPAFADNGDVEYLPHEPVYGVSDIWYMLLDTANTAYGWEFPYSDRFFEDPSSQFSLRFAQGSLGLALSAFRCNSGIIDNAYKVYLTEAGFTDLYDFGYDKPTTEDSLSGVIGMKKIDDFTVIAAVTCGQGYSKEWAGNFKVGTGVRHDGFNSAAGMLEDHIAHYISDKGIEGKKKLWLTGISRAGAVGNITAADAIDSGEYEDVYAYLFGVPRTTKEPGAYKGIYNINGQYDPVAATPFQSWGYERYGTDLYTPAQESDVNFPVYARKAKAIGDMMAKDGFRNNPEVNYQLRLIMEGMNEIFTSSEDYAERLQPFILKAMRESENKDWIGILITAMQEVQPRNARERAEIKRLINYLSYVAGQHMRAKQRQVEDGSWKPDESLAANLVIEHRPTTYIKWLFSQSDPQKLFSCSIESRRMTFIGDVGVEVYRDGKGVSAIDNKGNIYVPGEEREGADNGARGTFLMRNGNQTTLSLPEDADYNVVMISPRGGTVTVFDLLVSPEHLESEAGKLYIGRVHPGRYLIAVGAGEAPGEPVEMGGIADPSHFSEKRFNYSPTAVMGDELEATKGVFLSLSGAFILVRGIVCGLGILLLICLAIDIVHSIKRKRGHPAYSDWFVIVPHLICIAVFAVLTQYLSFYMFAVAGARAQCAAVTVFFIFLLALRGAIRSRKPMHYLITLALLAGVHITGLYYNRLPIDSYSALNSIVFYIIVGLLSTLAVRMFRRDKKPVTEGPKAEDSQEKGSLTDGIMTEGPAAEEQPEETLTEDK